MLLGSPRFELARRTALRELRIRGQRWRGRRGDVPFIALITIVGFVIFWPILSVRPTFQDNVVSLTLAGRDDPWSFWHGPVFSFQPTYRPFGFTLLWLQGQVADFHVWTYYLVNIVIWVACGCLLYAIVRHVSGSRVAALLAALLAISDRRTDWMLWVIEERQMSLAVLAGLSALLLTFRLESSSRRRTLLVAIALLLLAASLSIEYGLAFSAAVFAAGLVARGHLRKPLMAVALAAVGVYAALRLGAQGGSLRDYCESMGYFTTERPDPTCLSSLGTEGRIKQHLYNVAASAVGTVLPTLFSFDGVWAPYAYPRYHAIAGLALLALAVVGLATRPRVTIPLFTLWIANAVLSFYLYRSRNQVIGTLGIYAGAGIGAVELGRLALRAHLTYARVAVGAALVAAAAWVAFSVIEHADRIEGRQRQSRDGDPCYALVRYPDDASLAVVIRIKRRYNMSNPECAS